LLSNLVFVSGAGGYIGGGIVRALVQAGLPVLGGVRRASALPEGVTPVVTGDLAQADLKFEGVTAVVHAAGLGHRRSAAAATWRSANVEAAVNLAGTARAAGVTRFVLISTAHVHGRVHDGVVTDTSPTNAMDGYAASKLEAETQVAAVFGAGLSIVRPVAVIGPHCPGNLMLLMKLLRRGVPLPFGSIQNQRSFIPRDDLARLVLTILLAETPPPAVLAAHPENISTPALIRALASGMGVKPRLLPCPPPLLGFAAGILGREAMWQGLAGNYIADPQAARALGWSPRESLRESLRQTGQAYVVK
jgi:UDP-glucose 4-epimerase